MPSFIENSSSFPGHVEETGAVDTNSSAHTPVNPGAFPSGEHPLPAKDPRGRVNDEPAEDGFDAISGPQPIANF